ncbi:unnamed protein product [Amoebophrya sp. A25]|nr:unnamed protein product [Amoebophrya sp. A25]|eukprot:GSA25T00022322001.1
MMQGTKGRWTRSSLTTTMRRRPCRQGPDPHGPLFCSSILSTFEETSQPIFYDYDRQVEANRNSVFQLQFLTLRKYFPMCVEDHARGRTTCGRHSCYNRDHLYQEK